MSRLSLRLRLQVTIAAMMSLRVVMARVFRCPSVVIGLNITALMAVMSSTVVCCLYDLTLLLLFNVIYVRILYIYCTVHIYTHVHDCNVIVITNILWR